MISIGYLSLPQPLPEGEEFSDRHCYLVPVRKFSLPIGDKIRIL
jgi:hypothetical protein